MRLRDIVCDGDRYCPWRTSAIAGTIVMSFAMGAQAWTREIGMWDYLGYSLSIVIVSGAPLAAKIVEYVGPRLASAPMGQMPPTVTVPITVPALPVSPAPPVVVEAPTSPSVGVMPPMPSQ